MKKLFSIFLGFMSVWVCLGQARAQLIPLQSENPLKIYGPVLESSRPHVISTSPVDKSYSEGMIGTKEGIVVKFDKNVKLPVSGFFLLSTEMQKDHLKHDAAAMDKVSYYMGRHNELLFTLLHDLYDMRTYKATLLEDTVETEFPPYAINKREEWTFTVMDTRGDDQVTVMGSTYGTTQHECIVKHSDAKEEAWQFFSLHSMNNQKCRPIDLHGITTIYTADVQGVQIYKENNYVMMQIAGYSDSELYRLSSNATKVNIVNPKEIISLSGLDPSLGFNCNEYENLITINGESICKNY